MQIEFSKDVEIMREQKTEMMLDINNLVSLSKPLWKASPVERIKGRAGYRGFNNMVEANGSFSHNNKLYKRHDWKTNIFRIP